MFSDKLNLNWISCVLSWCDCNIKINGCIFPSSDLEMFFLSCEAHAGKNPLIDELHLPNLDFNNDSVHTAVVKQVGGRLFVLFDAWFSRCNHRAHTVHNQQTLKYFDKNEPGEDSQSVSPKRQATPRRL